MNKVNTQRESDILFYDGSHWRVVRDESIKASEHCNYCDFKHLCEQYIDEHATFACGCTFHADKLYIKYEKDLSNSSSNSSCGMR